jgi:hypothetical protein
MTASIPTAELMTTQVSQSPNGGVIRKPMTEWDFDFATAEQASGVAGALLGWTTCTLSLVVVAPGCFETRCHHFQ